MTADKRQKALAAYVRTIADALGLRDWQFTFTDEPPGEVDHEQATAAIQPTRGRKNGLVCGFLPAGGTNRRRTGVKRLLMNFCICIFLAWSAC